MLIKGEYKPSRRRKLILKGYIKMKVIDIIHADDNAKKAYLIKS